jgi:N-acetylglutamate synthase-like GNAT family acetyltransferase
MTAVNCALITLDRNVVAGDALLHHICGLAMTHGYACDTFALPMLQLMAGNEFAGDDVTGPLRLMKWAVAMETIPGSENLRTIGFAALEQDITALEPCQMVAMLFVAPDRRRAGVGTALLQLCERHARETKCALLACDAPLELAVWRFLLARGFALPDARVLGPGTSRLGKALRFCACAPHLGLGAAAPPPDHHAALVAAWNARAEATAAFIREPSATEAAVCVQFPEFVAATARGDAALQLVRRL